MGKELHKSSKAHYSWLFSIIALILVGTVLVGILFPNITAHAETQTNIGYHRNLDPKTANQNGHYGNYSDGKRTDGKGSPYNFWDTSKHGNGKPAVYVQKVGTNTAFYCVQPSQAANGVQYTSYPISDEKGKILDKEVGNLKKYGFYDQYEGAQLTAEQQANLLRVLLMYTKNKFNPGISEDYANSETPHKNGYATDGQYLAAQVLAWEIVAGERDMQFNHVDDSKFTSSNRIPVSSYVKGINKSIQSDYDAEYKRLETAVQNAMKNGGLTQIPSFAGLSKDTTPTSHLENDNSVTLKDENNVLSKYNVTSKDSGITATISGNNLRITSDKKLNKDDLKSITLTAKDGEITTDGILYVLYKSGKQTGVYTKPEALKAYVKVGANALDPFDLSLEKQSSAEGDTADLSGTEFTIKYYTNGNASGTPTGTYTVSPIKQEDGSYTTSITQAKKTSGTEWQTDKYGKPQFEDGTLVTVDETKAPTGFKKNPKWQVEGNGSVVGNTVQFKIDGSGQSANAKVTAVDSKLGDFDFSTKLADASGTQTFDADTVSSIDLIDTITIDSDSSGLDGYKFSAKGTVKDSNGDDVTTGSIDADSVKPGQTFEMKFPSIDLSKYKGTGKSVTFYCDEVANITKEGAQNKQVDEKGRFSPSQQVKITSTPKTPDKMTMQTKLASSDGATGVLAREKQTKLTDSVTLSNDDAEDFSGKSAILKGQLYDANQDKIGDEVTKDITLGQHSYTIDFAPFDSTDTSKYPDKRPVYASESVVVDGSTVAEEDGAQESDQQVTFDSTVPILGTTLTCKQTGNNTAQAVNGTLTLVDTVSYKQVTPGVKYTISGSLMDKETGEAVKDASGNPVTAKDVTFTASAASGTIDTTYEFKVPSNTAGKSYVAFEDLKDEQGKVVAKHHDIDAVTQTVTFGTPHEQISTSIHSKETGIRLANATKPVNLVDTVTYSGLTPNTEYVMVGTLMHRSSGTAITHNGKPVTNEVAFTSSASGNGTVDVPFSFNAKDLTLDGKPLNLAGQDIVSFEKLYDKGKTKVIARHEDRDDTTQIVHFPGGHTNARDAETLTQNSNAGKKVTIKDVVTYQNLIPGKTYTMTGTAYRKDTGKPLTDHGKVVSNTISFTPSSANGSVVVPVTFDASLLQGKRIVMFESCKYENYEVFVHADIDDHDQTIYIPELHTVAVNSQNGSHKVGVGNVKIADKVSYTNLIPGQEYTVEGVLMNKDTGKPVVVDGKQATGTATFTAKQATGYQVVDFKVDTSKIGTKHLVVFETLYTGNHKEVGHHKDIHDKDQAVIVTETVRTGGFPIVPVSVAAGAVVLSTGLYFIFRKKKHPNIAHDK